MWRNIPSSWWSFSCRNWCFNNWIIFSVISHHFQTVSLLIHFSLHFFVLLLQSAAHWSVRIDFVFVRIDNWSSSESLIVKVDSTSQIIAPAVASAEICGKNNYADSTKAVSTNFTHSASTMKITITTNLAKGNYIESFGIYNLIVLVDYVSYFVLNNSAWSDVVLWLLFALQKCPNKCTACDATGCTTCYTGFLSYKGLCYTTCPSGSF